MTTATQTNYAVKASTLYPQIIKLGKQENLSYDEVYQAFEAILDGEITNVELASLLLGLRQKGESVDEISAVVDILRENARRPQKITGTIDNCGTGGDKSGSFNISTTAAIVMAAAGAKVAKHGNKSITSKTGSSDVLTELGINREYTPELVVDQINKFNISFMFAPQAHPKMGQIGQVRNELGVPTLFNTTGPLINPVDLDYQYVGIYDRNSLGKIAEVQQHLGRKRAVVVNGANYMDEANLAGENHFAIVANGQITTKVLNATDFGLPTYAKETIKGGDSKENKQILLNVLENKATDAQRDTVLLNAGIGLFTAEKAENVKEGIDLARQTLAAGKAINLLHAMQAEYKD